MDIGVIGGLGITMGLILLSIIGDLRSFIDFNSVLVTIGGSFGSTLVAVGFERMKNLPKYLMAVFKTKKFDKANTIKLLVDLSNKARREGLLALEDSIEGLDDPFVKRGLQLVVDGVEPESVQNILNLDIDAMQNRHADGKMIFDVWAGFAPSFGMLGTIMGLVQMLKRLDDPSTIGPAMALALITTFYGAVMAYGVFQPMGNTLQRKSDMETDYRQMIVEGILGIQSGENPRLLEERLVSFLSPAERQQYDKMKSQRGEEVAEVA
ncbi:motility protein A [Coprothermobacter platensis]|uniref:motility protein A n=1 Tax=Coprothermobacter platensis TaxID=108819 RepID=UPI00037A7EA7|nr:motility protein A [Coprothermobacter platensis]